jgi:aquaporin Z
VSTDRADLRRYAAELLGTFVLVFIGTSSVVAAGRGGAPVVLVAAFAFGLALLAGLYAFAEVSGGHFNPAVSLAFFLDGRLTGPDLLAYWGAQLLGATLGSVVLLIATTRADVAATANNASSAGTGFVIELTLTAIFVAVILQASRSERFGSSGLIAIPLTLTAAHLVAIPFTGCSVNPARSFGPALVGGKWSDFWLFVLAPLLGGALAVAVHRWVIRPQPQGVEPAVAEVLREPVS